MLPAQISQPWILANAASLLMCVVAYLWPRAGRALFAALFFATSAVTGYLALTQPGYFIVGPAEAARLALYREFILGFFRAHVVALALALTTLLFLIGLALVLGDVLLPIGITGGVVFLALLAPLGTWVAFPAPLLLALGLACVRVPPEAREGRPR
jgi:hypothetical protein